MDQPKFPADDSTVAGDWSFALAEFFGVGRGVPPDWWTKLPVGELAKRAKLLRSALKAPTNAEVARLFTQFEPALALQPSARIVHTGNFLFAMQTAAVADKFEVIVLNWTQTQSAQNYITRDLFKRSDFTPNVASSPNEICRISLTPIEETFGMAVRATCHDSNDKPTFVSVIAVGLGTTGMELFVFSGCEDGVAGGSFLNVAPNKRKTIEQTFGFPYTNTVFFIHRTRGVGTKNALRIGVNSNFDDWQGRRSKRLQQLQEGGFILGVDNSKDSTALFQINIVDGEFGIEEVPLLDDGVKPTRLICTLDVDMATNLSKNKPGSRYVLVDSSYDHIDHVLYVAYEDRGSANTINVRQIPRDLRRETSRPPDFLQTKLVNSRVKSATSHSYSFRLGNELVVAKQGTGFETIPLSVRVNDPRRSIETYASRRENLENVYVVPRKNNATFNGQVFRRRFADDDDN